MKVNLRILSLMIFAALLSVGASNVYARPNIILISTDDQRADELWGMPNLQSKMVQRGTMFRNAFAPFPLCCPARASIMTGQHAHNHDVLSNGTPLGGYSNFESGSTLATWMQSAGYLNAFVGKYINEYGKFKPVTVPPGWTEWHASVGGGDYFESRLRESTGGPPVSNNYTGYITDLYTDKAVDVINRRMRSQPPMFLWVSYYAPHLGTPAEPDDPGIGTPAVAPRHANDFAGTPLRKGEYDPSFNEADVSDKPGYVKTRNRLTSSMMGQLTELYQQRLESLLAVDEGIARIFAAVEAAGQLDNTIFVFTSDNGYMLGEHRIPTGKTLPYTPSSRVPMVVRGPGFPAGVQRLQPVALIDLSPTFLEAAQGTAGLPQDGVSLFPIAADPSTRSQRELLIEAGPRGDLATGPWFYRGVRSAKWLYVKYEETGEVEMYDLVKDPYQLVNVVSDPDYTAERNRLSQRLVDLRNCAGVTCR